MNDCVGVYGNIGSLDYTATIELDNTNCSGIVSLNAECTYWSLNNTNLTKVELEQSLVNIADYAVEHDINAGHFECKTNMPVVDSEDACIAKNRLEQKQWIIIINHNCGGSGS